MANDFGELFWNKTIDWWQLMNIIYPISKKKKKKMTNEMIKYSNFVFKRNNLRPQFNPRQQLTK